MGIIVRLLRRLETRLDKPADQSVLFGDRNAGSERMIKADSAAEDEAVAEAVRKSRDQRRWRFRR